LHQVGNARRGLSGAAEKHEMNGWIDRGYPSAVFEIVACEML
jgi:hypothetical protein